ncbi:MAG: hypothetical protein K2F79_08260 [Muribaculaceae bacterium]|nr:hypothetical protein [Muribaculaceae bacterium]
MRKPSRKRINLSVTEATHDQLTRVAFAYGFRNVCELTTTLINVALGMINRRPSAPPVEEAAEEIRKMFEDLSRHEEPEYGAASVRHNNTNRDGTR